MLLDDRSFFLSLLIKVVSTLAISAVSFRFYSLKELCKNTLLTFCVSFAFSGIMIAVYQLFRPSNMLIVNDIVYFEVDPLLLLALTGAIYLLVYVIERIFREKLKTSVVRLEFTLGEQRYTCMGKIDTGCSLSEPFSGAPVIIVDSGILTLPDTPDKRVIPYDTVGSSSILFAVKASSASINGKPVSQTVYIAEGSVPNTAYQAIIHSEIAR